MADGALKLTLYSKDDCPLCDEMLEIIESLRGSERFELEKIDILTDEALTKTYGLEIPVLFINDRKAFKARLTKTELKKKMKKARELADKRQKNAPPSLEALSPEPYRPPSVVAAGLIAATIAGVGYFVSEGLASAEVGRRTVTGQLLKIQARSDDPIEFDLPDYVGEQVKLQDLRDKVVLINFWATWCPPCVEEMPSIRKLHGKLADRPDFEMLLISADESWEPVRTFFAEDPPKVRVLLDESGDLANRYGTTMFPETYLVVDGKVVAFIEGPRDWDAWYAEAYLASFLSPPGSS